MAAHTESVLLRMNSNWRCFYSFSTRSKIVVSDNLQTSVFWKKQYYLQLQHKSTSTSFIHKISQHKKAKFELPRNLKKKKIIFTMLSTEEKSVEINMLIENLLNEWFSLIVQFGQQLKKILTLNTFFFRIWWEDVNFLGRQIRLHNSDYFEWRNCPHIESDRLNLNIPLPRMRNSREVSNQKK